MVCIFCHSETQVFNSRHQRRTNTVWRRRKCLVCKRNFSTVEQPDYEKSWVVQYPAGRDKPFARDKLFISLYKSLQHRGDAVNDAIGLTATIMANLQITAQDGAVTATAIAMLCHTALKRFDRAAAVSYQAFHADVL